MERYTKWRDAGTGLQPFLPVAQGIGEEGTGRPRWAALVLAALRAPLIVVTLAVWAVLSALLAWAPRSLVLRVNAAIGGFALTLICGTSAPPRAMQKRLNSEGFVAARSDTLPAALQTRGAVLVCNHQSPVDILWAVAHVSPAYVALPLLASASADARATLVVLPPLAAVLLCGRVLRADSKCPFWRVLRATVVRDVESLDAAAVLGKRAGGPVVVPLEGTTTNGRGLLRPLEGVFGDIPIETHALAFSHAPLGPGAATPLAGSLARHLLWDAPVRSSRFGALLTVRWLHSSVLSDVIDKHSASDVCCVAETISALLSPRRPVLALTMRDKASFVAAYRP